MGTSSKPKSRNQIIKWLKDPHSDSAEYKMWGNGVALPNVCFVLSGIVYYAQFSEFFYSTYLCENRLIFPGLQSDICSTKNKGGFRTWKSDTM